MDVNDSNLTTWLFANGGPVMRYRTAKELLEKPTVENLNLAEDAAKLLGNLVAGSPETL